MNTILQAPAGLEMLNRQQFISLTTFRKSGAGVSTPVWFALAGGKFYGTSQARTGKVKRMRNNPRVTFAPCTYNGKLLGEAAPGSARLLSPEEYSAAAEALKRKYGLQYRVLTWYAKMRGSSQVFWEIVPD
jgi:uncharacterized protein